VQNLSNILKTVVEQSRSQNRGSGRRSGQWSQAQLRQHLPTQQLLVSPYYPSTHLAQVHHFDSVIVYWHRIPTMTSMPAHRLDLPWLRRRKPTALSVGEAGIDYITTSGGLRSGKRLQFNATLIAVQQRRYLRCYRRCGSKDAFAPNIVVSA